MIPGVFGRIKDGVGFGASAGSEVGASQSPPFFWSRHIFAHCDRRLNRFLSIAANNTADRPSLAPQTHHLPSFQIAEPTLVRQRPVPQ
jgi:hypothetical protein